MDKKRKPDPPAIERQKFKRVAFEREILFSPVIESKIPNTLEVPDQSHYALGHNVSEGGIRLALTAQPPATGIIRVTFDLWTAQSVTAYAKLIWKTGAMGGFEYLVLPGDDRRKIKYYVERKIRGKTRYFTP